MVCGVFARLRQICTLSLDKKNLVLGGVGQIVEIDESMYAKVKHWKGKDLDRDKVWVFGLVERNTEQFKSSKCYMQIVDDREAETLISIVVEKCKSGTIIYSDCWASYNKLSSFKDFQHKTVNHSINFIDPKTGACTNRIESLWNSCKQKFKEMRGCKRIYIQSYIDEFLWRFNNKVSNDRVASYALTLKDIARFYKPGRSLSDYGNYLFEKIPDFDVHDPELLESESKSETGSDCGSASLKYKKNH